MSNIGENVELLIHKLREMVRQIREMVRKKGEMVTLIRDMEIEYEKLFHKYEKW